MTADRANGVYDILVNIGGASENMRDSFIFSYTCTDVCTEWRFMGKLGFGGKYRSEYNSVDCYQEDETKERLETIDKINKELKKIDE